MVHATGLVMGDDGLTAMGAGAVPSVHRVEGVAVDQAKRSLVEHARVEHLAVARLKHPEFLHLAGKQDHRQHEQREVGFHGDKYDGAHLNMCQC